MIIDELIAILGYDVKGEGELDKFNRGLDRAQQRAERVANRINMMSVAVGTFLGNIASQAVTRLSSAIGSLPGDVLKVGQEFENLETVLTTIEGSSTKAKEAMDWVQDFAAKTPYDLGQVSEAFVRMRAYGLDPMGGLLQRVGDAAAGMGKSLMQGVEAIADAVTGENERLKEFGIKTKVQGDQITYNWNENGKEMTKTVRKNGPEIIAALTEIFGRFDGAMDKLSKTQAGIIANLGDTWAGFLKTIGDKGYYEEITRRLSGVQETIAKWDKDGVLDRAAQGISNLLVGGINLGAHLGGQLFTIGQGAYYAANGVVELISRVTGLNKTVSAGVLGAALVGRTKIGRGLMMALARRIPMLGAILLGDDILTGLKGGDSYIGSLEGGQAALERARENFEKLRTAADDLAASLNKVFHIDISGFLANPDEFMNRELVRFVNDLALGFDQLARSLDALRKGDWRGAIRPFLKDGDKGAGARDAQGEDDGVVDRMLKGMGDERANAYRSYLDSKKNGNGSPVANFMSNWGKLDAGNAANAVINDNKQDNRDQSSHVEVNVGGVHVQQAVEAPAAAGQAVGNAIAGAAVPPARRITGN